MNRNWSGMGRYGWIALAIVGGAAAMRMTGWQRTAVGAMAATGFGSALRGYPLFSRVLGRTRGGSGSPLDQGLHDTELRRHAAMRSALGTSPSTGSDQRRVTADTDMFGSR